MRYSCEEIKYFLAHDDLDPTDERAFLNHLENCKSCREEIALEPDLEEILAVSIPRCSPLSFKKDILPEINRMERGKAKQSRIEKITFPVIILITFIPAILTTLFWDEIRSVPGSLNLAGVYDRMTAFISGLNLSAFSLTEINTFIGETPLLTLTLISITAIIWAFSIMEAQKALK
jgi:hypothetical protein